jgi:predicted TIM-barrel fold metal-dependent hydrolase
MFDFYTRPKPPLSEELASAYKPYIETCIAAFGVNRAMFESNFSRPCCTIALHNLWRNS